jgi:N-acetylglucosaminyltransferase
VLAAARPRHPQDILILPVLAFTVIIVALPIKLYAFATMNKQGWLTRHADQIGGDGQDAVSLETKAEAEAHSAQDARGAVV